MNGPGASDLLLAGVCEAPLRWELGSADRGRQVTGRAPRGSYVAVAERIREQITSGELPKGASLPSETKFAAQHGLGRGTMRKVLGELEHDGLVYSVPGQGWVVGGPADRSAIPTPAEVTAVLRAELDSGTYESGSPFVTATEVCDRFGITRHAARRALATLEDAGLIVSLHGKGRFVAPYGS